MCPITVVDGDIHVTGNVIIKGNLHVQGNFTVGGSAEINKYLSTGENINCYGGAFIKSHIITTGGDVKTNKCTLDTHKHKGDSGGITSPPIG